MEFIGARTCWILRAALEKNKGAPERFFAVGVFALGVVVPKADCRSIVWGQDDGICRTPLSLDGFGDRVSSGCVALASVSSCVDIRLHRGWRVSPAKLGCIGRGEKDVLAECYGEAGWGDYCCVKFMNSAEFQSYRPLSRKYL